jgi:hypothetical protein
MAKIVTCIMQDGEVEYALRTVSFAEEPVHLSPEHARHFERFTGYPYNAEQEAALKGWVAFKRWHHELQLAHARQRLISTLRAVLRAKD